MVISISRVKINDNAELRMMPTIASDITLDGLLGIDRIEGHGRNT